MDKTHIKKLLTNKVTDEEINKVFQDSINYFISNETKPKTEISAVPRIYIFSIKLEQGLQLIRKRKDCLLRLQFFDFNEKEMMNVEQHEPNYIKIINNNKEWCFSLNAIRAYL